MAPNFTGQIYLKMSVFLPVLGACGTIKLNMRDGFGSLNLNLIQQSRYQCVLTRSAALRDHRHLKGRR